MCLMYCGMYSAVRKYLGSGIISVVLVLYSSTLEYEMNHEHEV